MKQRNYGQLTYNKYFISKISETTNSYGEGGGGKKIIEEWLNEGLQPLKFVGDMNITIY